MPSGTAMGTRKTSTRKKASKTSTRKKASKTGTRGRAPARGARSQPKIIVEAPIPKFHPNELQRALIALPAEGAFLIRGEAGAGKTMTLLARLAVLDTMRPNDTSLYLTYNRSLASHAERVLRSAGCSSRVKVSTFHEWSRDLCSAIGLRIKKWTLGDDRKLILETLARTAASASPSLAARPESFWDEELAWIYGRGFREFSEFDQSSRAGRGGPRLTHEDRYIVWGILAELRRQLSVAGSWDAADPAGLFAAALHRNGGRIPGTLRVDHIFVDEVQDFDRSWLAMTSPFARQSMTLAGDLAQRIYPRRFTWRSAGIDLPPSRSKSLVGTRRTTRPIMDVATRVATNADLVNEADFQQPTVSGAEGDKPVLMLRSDRTLMYMAAAMAIAELRRARPSETIGVFAPTRTGGYGMRKALELLSVDAIVVRGETVGRRLDVVEITTCHQAKGLEWDHVFLVDVGDGTMPGKFIDGDEDPEVLATRSNQLRRLLFVAMTRARRSLTVAATRPASRFFDAIPPRLWDER